MTMGASFCPNCGVASQPGARFCASCGQALPEPGPGQQPFEHQDLAKTVINVQNFNLKVIAGRIVGVVAALALWYVFVLPIIDDNILLVLGLVLGLPFVGMIVGERVTLLLLAR